MSLLFWKRSSHGERRLDLGEFQASTLTWIMLCQALGLIVWQIFTNQQLLLVISLFLLVPALALVNRARPAAILLWIASSTATAAIAAVQLNAPALLLLAGLVPLLVLILFGGLAGLLAGGMVWGGFWLAARLPALTALSDMLPLALLGVCAGLAAAAIVRYWLIDTLRTYYENYLQANQEINEARAQRVEFRQVQEDLLHANRELARLARQLKLANQAADEARRAKETFVATVSHELRTPLNMIIGFSEVISQSPQVYGARLPQTLLADISSIQRNSRHLLELVNDVLDLSQVDMGNLSISRGPCTVQQIVEEALDVIRPLFQSKNLFLTAELPDEAIALVCDHTRIREVLINLLSNAGRFTETGGVTVRAAYANQNAILSVTDTGPGIAPEDHHRLFEPFQQLDDSIRRKHGGSGLGLAISKRFVEMHGGEMWLESRLGEGTTFFFSLPLETEAAPRAARWVNPVSAVDPRARAFKAPAAAPTPRWVVLETGGQLCHLLDRYAPETELVHVENEEAAVAAINGSPTQLLIINHPEAGRLLDALLQRGELPFNLRTLALWMAGSETISEQLGIQRYLVKPISKDMLLGAIDALERPVQTLLMVDDNQEVLQLFGRILTAAGKGYQLLRASNGRQALEMLRKRKPDAMILDLVMPEMTGWQVLTEKAADPTIRDIPVITISAQDPIGLPKINAPILLARAGGYSPKELLDLIKMAGNGGIEPTSSVARVDQPGDGF